MSIGHWNIVAPEPDEPFVFAELADFTCSICAPNSMTKFEVEAFADRTLPGEPWRSVDKSKFGFGSATPNPCNSAPIRRTHWFMMRGVLCR